MEKSSQSECPYANGAGRATSFVSGAGGVAPAYAWRIPLLFSINPVILAVLLGGCGADAPKPAAQVETKRAEPIVPEDVQSAAKALLGSEKIGRASCRERV